MENQEKKSLIEEIRAQIQNAPNIKISLKMLDYIERKMNEIYLLQITCIEILRELEHKEKLTEQEERWHKELGTVLFEIEVI